jgi:hypothetical protein
VTVLRPVEDAAEGAEVAEIGEPELAEAALARCPAP